MKAIVFDWDGTLADTLGAHYAANEVVLAGLGIPFDADRYRRGYAPDWRTMYLRLGVPAALIDEANERWQRAFDAIAAARPFPGARDAVARLRVAGHAIGLVTASRRATVEPQLAALGFDGLFDAAVYGDDLVEAKPDPAPLRRALVGLGLANGPDRVTYVGDVPDDMRMAVAVGARPVGVVSLLGREEELLSAGAVEVVRSVADWAERQLSTGAAS